MAKLAWHSPGERRFQAGCDRGVLYPPNSAPGVPWNGLVSVETSVTGGETRPVYQDGAKFSDARASTEFQGTLTALYSPREFDVCEGIVEIEPGYTATNQPVKPFGLSWRTGLGDELEGLDRGYKLHLLYNATVVPAARSASTLTETIETAVLSWDISAVPRTPIGFRPTAYFVVDSTRLSSTRLAQIEAQLYGTSSTPPLLPPT